MRSSARHLLTFAAGRRTKFLVLAVWVAIAGIAGSFAGKLEDAEQNDPSAFLPGDAESVATLDAVDRFPSGDTTPTILVPALVLDAGDRAW